MKAQYHPEYAEEQQHLEQDEDIFQELHISFTTNRQTSDELEL